MLVVWGWAIIGFVAETYGFFLLFRGFFPTVLSFLRNVPFLGRLLDAPALKTVGCNLRCCLHTCHRMHSRNVSIGMLTAADSCPAGDQPNSAGTDTACLTGDNGRDGTRRSAGGCEDL
jgi:hypothetical protein